MKFWSLFGGWLLALGLVVAPALASEPGRNIGVFGDSLGDGVWSGLYVVLKKQHPADHVFRHAKVGAGLTRSDFTASLPEFAASLDSEKIDTAIVMVGANDQESIRDDTHKGYLFQSAGWKRTYIAHIDALFAEFNKRKIKVIWLGLPILRKDELNPGAAYLNDIFAESVTRNGGIFVPLIDRFKGADGGFASHLPDAEGHLQKIRTEDGTHFTQYGYELIAQLAYDAIPGATASSAPGAQAVH